MEEMVQPKVNRARWHFWFLIVVSILLIVVFVFYLPLRFQSNTQEHEENSSLIEENEHLNVIDFLFPVARADEGQIFFNFSQATLRPAIAGFARAFSSVSVVANSMLLKRYTPPIERKAQKEEGEAEKSKTL